MSPSWITPKAAVATIEDLLALLMSGYTVELTPLDLLGPDRAVLRLRQQQGEATEGHEVRIATMRGLATGIRALRVLALGNDDLADDEAPGNAGSNGHTTLPLGLMAAMMGMGSGSGHLAGSPEESGSSKQVRATNPAGMADAIAAALRPPRTLPNANEDTTDGAPSSVDDARR